MLRIHGDIANVGEMRSAHHQEKVWPNDTDHMMVIFKSQLEA